MTKRTVKLASSSESEDDALTSTGGTVGSKGD